MVVGIDDWAWRRNQRYGTLVCDLERRHVVCLLPDREAGTAEAWLAGQPQIALVARDRSGNYALAAARALPHAAQVAAGRWHLMENASRAFAALSGMPLQAVEQISGHSTRVGVAQDIAADRIEMAAIIQSDGWKTPAMIARYTARQDARRSGASKLATKQKRAKKQNES